MKKKIFAVDQGEYIGGAERFFSELLSRLPDDEIHLISSGNSEYERLYKKESVVFHHIEMPKLRPLRLKQLIQYRKSQAKLRTLITSLKPDVILSNTVRTHLLVSPLAKKFRIPLIWMAHDKTFPSTLLKWFLKYPRTVISCSRFIQKYYASHTKRTDISFDVLYPFGIDQKEIMPLKKIRKKKMIGMIGKFVGWKNQLTFLEVVKDLEAITPEYRFEIIGSPYDGNQESEEYFKKCSSFVKQNNLQKRIFLKKSVPNVLQSLARWEILVHCSNEPEPLGRVVLEGMAAGCAVIASPFGGPSEVVQHRQTGILARPDVKTLKKEISDLLKDPEERKKIARAAQAKIEQDYDWEKVIKQVQTSLRIQ